MAVTLNSLGRECLGEAVEALRQWQRDSGSFQLHPGDVGWFWRFGADAATAAVRSWKRDERVVAVGLLDGDDLLRLAIAPGTDREEELASRLAADLTNPARGILPEGRVAVEAPEGAVIKDVLSEAGWQVDEPWTPLQRDLTQPVEDGGVRIEVVRPDLAEARAEVQRASFDKSRFTADSWRAMVAGPLYADARCLLAFDRRNNAVATITVWSAGPGRPGLIEPMGTHRDHRGHGYGRAVTLAGAAALRDLGASSALVCTEGSNTAAIATYRSAGFAENPERRDRYRQI
ncbi:MAG TPA: GNAT family N-acetyltransferase [Galbitalea sp.]|nr:GNAT family N-acetyltransferase [Galbitalea sp.]